MKESDMWRKLSHEFKKVFPHARIMRIESHATMLGIPDVNFRTAYIEGWIELKQLKKGHYVWRVPFRPGQYNWLKKQYMLNGIAILLATIDKQWYYFEGEDIKEVYSFNELVNYTYEEIFGWIFHQSS